ncbi:hypothetical protein Leryth_005078 [Lithospermum erythrorhizon]|nr:hypothetical protein Leryth_005078 [Lithospermum erythrorhizon]
MSHFSVMHWSSLTCNKSEVLNVSGHVAPHEKHPGSLLEGFTQTQVSTLAVKDNLLVAGGRTYLQVLLSFFFRSWHFTTSNNDCGVTDFDMETFQLVNHFRFPWPVNIQRSEISVAS